MDFYALILYRATLLNVFIALNSFVFAHGFFRVFIYRTMSSVNIVLLFCSILMISIFFPSLIPLTRTTILKW